LSGLLFALAALWSAPQESPRIYSFDIDVHAVYIDVYVTRDGKPAADIDASRFTVFDNGVRQSLDLVTKDVTPLSTMLLLDISGSVSGEKVNDLRAAAHFFVDGLDPRDEVGLVSFTRRMRLGSSMSGDFARIHAALDEPMGAGETGLNDALFAGLSLLHGSPGRPLVLVFSDGLENTSWLTTSEVLEQVRGAPVVIHVVAVTTPQIASRSLSGRARTRNKTVIAAKYLSDLTEATGGREWSAESTSELRAIYLSILAEMKNRYLIGYQPRGVPLPGWHEFRVEVDGFGPDEVRARPGYSVQP